MTSQVDLDQGGTFRQFVRKYLGPSVGWVYVPETNIVPVTAAGTVTLVIGVTLVPVNIAGAVIIVLPPIKLMPSVPAGALPGPAILSPVTAVDVGGFASAHPITLLPAAGDTIMSLPSISIATAYGGYTLSPNPVTRVWTPISP